MEGKIKDIWLQNSGRWKISIVLNFPHRDIISEFIVDIYASNQMAPDDLTK
jgi:hypothetical protein